VKGGAFQPVFFDPLSGAREYVFSVVVKPKDE
jgi:hypothetical protein